MDQTQGGQAGWINSLLTELDLIQASTDCVDVGKYWTQVENCRLSERMGRVVADINGAAGYHVIELLDFLPPQKKVLRISFTKKRIQYVMAIVLRDSGVVLVFYTLKTNSAAWERYFPQSRGQNAAIVAEYSIQPSEILEEDIRNWFSYLLSGLEKKFKPGIATQTDEASGAHLNTLFNKASA